MARMSRRRVHPPVLATVLLVVLLGGAGYEGYTLHRTMVWNRLIASPASIGDSPSLPAPILFAKARHLESQGRNPEALRLYNDLEHGDDPTVRERATYNIGCIYLREAARLWSAQGVWAHAQVGPLVELARAAFTEVLRRNPDDWNARFNLELALRIKPPPKEAEKADWTGRKSSVYALMPGIPGGGP